MERLLKIWVPSEIGNAKASWYMVNTIIVREEETLSHKEMQIESEAKMGSGLLL